MPRLSKIGAAALAAFGWTSGSSVTATYLVVAGGGGGGGFNNGAGGGAGGLLTGTTSLNPTLSYAITVGAGGAGGNAASGNSTIGTSGGNSVFSSVTSAGGGGGSGWGGSAGPAVNGAAGGSGGGGGAGQNSLSTNGAGGAGNTPATSPSQGNNGGSGLNAASGGGGGAGATGGNASGANTAGGGGNGTASSISGSSVTYAGGGGGSAQNTGTAGTGGTGGGGAGGVNTATPTAGTANTGGGGGGAWNGPAGATGGSGIVIISYPGAQQFGGGNVTTDGTNTIHTFTTSGTLVPATPLTAQYLIVAGGAGGGGNNHTVATGGGGGAGGLLTGTGLAIDANSNYVVVVGAGGAGGTGGAGTNGVNGTNSSFSMVATAAVGGGYGATNQKAGGNGGSGGGASGPTTAGSFAGGTATSGQGNAGGSANQFQGGGGGGAGAAGASGATGLGGVGLSSSISGTATYYAGGGGTTTASLGGGGIDGGAGTANTGGGGGRGAGGANNAGGAGGSGIVIIAYPGATQQMAGGTVTISGGNVIHTFTSSGYLTPIKYASRSLRFRSSAGAFLSRTPTVSGNTTTFTYSVWAKRGSLSSTQYLFWGGNNCNFGFGLIGTDDLGGNLRGTGGTNYFFNTSGVFRDPSAWYHIVWAVDTTQATDTNRLKLYVNGVQQTLSVTYPPQNTVELSTAQRNIGSESGRYYFDGYMTEVNFIDGAALTPSSFGTFNSFGVWQPITYGGSYGTNGFYLPMNPGTSTYAGLVSSSNYLTAPSNAAFAVGTSDFTMETWFYPTSASQTGQFFFVSTGGIQMGYLNSSNWGLCHANVAWQTTTGTLPTTNAWNHMAITRSGTTIALFMNGVRLATGTIGTNYAQNTCVIGQGIIGYMSNSRFVKGTAVYNPSNPTYTVPTAPLTNITNTSLLTFQDSTNIDNSSNAFSLTATGTVTDSVAYPFNLGTIPDYSPQGNNWTANNIQPVAGVSMDVMLDVPTLTSATVANYPTWNPLTAGGLVTFSEANLKALSTSASAPSNIASTLKTSTTGKWYAEVTVAAGANNPAVGIGNNPSTSNSNTDQFTAYRTNATYITGSMGASSTGTPATYTTNDIIGIAYDVAAGTLVFYKNGTLQSGGFTGITVGSYSFIVRKDSASGDGGFLNCGQRPFTYTPPSGFVALNTYNLSTPTIPNGAVYMAATTYTGTGAALTVANTVNGTFFQPDFVWVKDRSAAQQHLLYDVIRGASNFLTSNSTAAEGTNNQTLTAFNSNGFSLGTNGTSNSNGGTFVGWQWAANGAGVTNTSGSLTSTVSANTTSGCSIATYTGTNSICTVGHGLGVAPSFIVAKSRSVAGGNWVVYHVSLGNTKIMLLNLTSAASVNANGWNNLSPTSTVINFGAQDGVNGNCVAYSFAPIAGYSAIGSYTGNGSADGPFVFLGFRPRWIMIKNSDIVSQWFLYDTTRSPYNQVILQLFANTADAQDSTGAIDILSNGFKLRGTGVQFNGSGNLIVYMAFAENPFKYSLAR